MNQRALCVVNVGVSKFYLHQTAQILDSYGYQVVTISGLIPFTKSRLSLNVRKFGSLNQLNQRISSFGDKVIRHEAVLSEIFWQIGAKLSRYKILNRFSRHFYWTALAFGDLKALAILYRHRDSISKIYYVRSGFGNYSIKWAKKLGYKIVVDHSIAHPLYLLTKVQNKKSSILKTFSIENRMLIDIRNSSKLITNSNFVVETFKIMEDYRNFEVLLPPIDKNFSSKLQKCEIQRRSSLVYFGTANFRKGIQRFADVVMKLPKTMPIATAGKWESEADAIKKRLLQQPNISIYNHRDNLELLEFLNQAKYFLFITQAEGSARTVAEAMHAGVIVLTTVAAGIPFDSTAMIDISELTDEEIVNTILKLEENPELCIKMGNRAREYILELEAKYTENLLTFLEKS